MATVPTVPTFTTNQTPTIAQLNQLASCVTFVAAIPAFFQGTTSSTTVANSTSTALAWSKNTDRDGGWASGNPTRYTAQTPAYYQLDALAVFALNATGDRQAYFQITTGSNNPGGAGNTTIFGEVAVAAGGTCNLTLSQQSPYMYVLDYVEVYVNQTSGGALSVVGSVFEVTMGSLGP